MGNFLKPSFIKKVAIASLLVNTAVLAFVALGKLKFSTKKTQPSINCNQICMDYQGKGPYPLINGFQLKQMVLNYQQPSNSISWTQGTRGIPVSSWKIQNSTPNEEDARSAWFSLHDLKYFLWEIETKVCQNPCMNLTSDKLGVRIYYARYPMGSLLIAGNPKYENLHTVFMIPTFDSPNTPTIHYDFALDSTIMAKSCKPIPLPHDTSNNDNNQLRSFKISTYLLPDGKNHGDLCPPVCQGGNAF